MDSMKINAIRADYNRKTKSYSTSVIYDIHLIGAYVSEGWLVWNGPPSRVVADIDSGRLIGSWNEKKRAAVRAHLAEMPD